MLRYEITRHAADLYRLVREGEAVSTFASEDEAIATARVLAANDHVHGHAVVVCIIDGSGTARVVQTYARAPNGSD